MSLTCQNVIDRAKAMNPLNINLTSDKTEMLTRIRGDQQELFTNLAGSTRDRFKAVGQQASTSAASGRSVDLSLTPFLSLPVERVLKVTLPDGREASQVDELDLEAELAPRYFVRGTKLFEVSNDWAAASGSQSLTILYVYGMTDIDPTGSLTQVISLPDNWIELLSIPLAMYLHQKDPGRDPVEYERLESMLTSRQAAFLSYLENYGGVESKRFLQPAPKSDSRKK